MKFYALIVLPIGTDITDAERVEAAASTLMAPFKMWQDDVPAKQQHWDWYWCCTKDWLTQSQVDFNQYKAAVPENPYLIFPAETLTQEGVTDSIVTPDGQWHRSQSTYALEDGEWPDKALGICSRYTGHHAVLAYCHG